MRDIDHMWEKFPRDVREMYATTMEKNLVKNLDFPRLCPVQRLLLPEGLFWAYRKKKSMGEQICEMYRKKLFACSLSLTPICFLLKAGALVTESVILYYQPSASFFLVRRPKITVNSV